MPNWLEFRALVLAWLIIAGIGLVAALSLHFIFRTPAGFFRYQRRRAVPWNGPMVLLAFLVFYGFRYIVLPYIDPVVVGEWVYGSGACLEAGRTVAGIIAAILSLPLQIAAWRALPLLGDGPKNVFGFVPRRLPQDFTAAFMTWLWLTPLVYIVNFAAVTCYGFLAHRPPDEHPLMQVLQSGTPSAHLFLLVFVQAVIVAPIGEEFFFRGIVQPFLADRPWGGAAAAAMACVVGVLIHRTRPTSFADPMAVATTAAPALFVLAMLPALLWSETWPQFLRLSIRDPGARRRAVGAIVGTALLFANFHANVWPTPIPLFVLALGLGWLACRTQSVVAPIFLHMLFNAIVFLAIPPARPVENQADIGKSATTAVMPRSFPSTDNAVPACSNPRRT